MRTHVSCRGGRDPQTEKRDSSGLQRAIGMELDGACMMSMMECNGQRVQTMLGSIIATARQALRHPAFWDKRCVELSVP